MKKLSLAMSILLILLNIPMNTDAQPCGTNGTYDTSVCVQEFLNDTTNNTNISQSDLNNLTSNHLQQWNSAAQKAVGMKSYTAILGTLKLLYPLILGLTNITENYQDINNTNTTFTPDLLKVIQSFALLSQYVKSSEYANGAPLRQQYAAALQRLPTTNRYIGQVLNNFLNEFPAPLNNSKLYNFDPNAAPIPIGTPWPTDSSSVFSDTKGSTDTSISTPKNTTEGSVLNSSQEGNKGATFNPVAVEDKTKHETLPKKIQGSISSDENPQPIQGPTNFPEGNNNLIPEINNASSF